MNLVSEGLQHRRQPSTFSASEMVSSNHYFIAPLMANEPCMNKDSIRTIHNEDLDMQKILHKHGSKFSEHFPEKSTNVCQGIIKSTETETDLLHGREHHLLRKKAQQLKSNVMLRTFIHVRGIVHNEFMPQGQTINQHVHKLSDSCSGPEEVRVVTRQAVAVLP